MYKALFVDRDGTLILEPHDFQVDRLDKVKLVDGVIPALNKFQAAGYRLIMVSNQDGLGTASFPQEDFQPVHDFIVDLFSSQGITFTDTLICPHRPDAGCTCRKPRLGLVTKYLQDPQLDWQRSAVIGDRESDLELAIAMDVRGYQLSTGGGEWSWSTLCADLLSQPRRATASRTTKETNIRVQVNLDGDGTTDIATGIGFFDHMLEQLGKHSRMNLQLAVEGDLEIDDHHTVEDTGIALGEAVRQALSDKIGVGRYGFSLPMDECRAEALIDLSGRAVTKIEVPFSTPRLGTLATEMIPHFFQSFASAIGMNLHLTVSPGNNHHMAEAAFKAVARALQQAVAISDPGNLPTTKGRL